jgi:hypothetical protein
VSGSLIGVVILAGPIALVFFAGIALFIPFMFFVYCCEAALPKCCVNKVEDLRDTFLRMFADSDMDRKYAAERFSPKLLMLLEKTLDIMVAGLVKLTCAQDGDSTCVLGLKIALLFPILLPFAILAIIPMLFIIFVLGPLGLMFDRAVEGSFARYFQPVLYLSLLACFCYQCFLWSLDYDLKNFSIPDFQIKAELLVSSLTSITAVPLVFVRFATSGQCLDINCCSCDCCCSVSCCAMCINCSQDPEDVNSSMEHVKDEALEAIEEENE